MHDRRRTGGALPRAITLAGVALLLVTGAGTTLAGRAPGPAVSEHRIAAGGVLLTANPTEGTAPLLVDFSLSIPNGTPSRYSWSFGDGAYLNGTGAVYATPSHIFDSPGDYEAVATAFFPGGAENASIPIDVVSSGLAVHLNATPVSGAVPLTVTFHATPEGGTGTFVSYLWSFGDGSSGSGLDLQYTYVTTGTFRAEITIVDSSGQNATAATTVTVGPVSPSPGGAGNNSTNGSGAHLGSDPAGSSTWTRYLPDLTLGSLIVGIGVFAGAVSWISYRRRSAGRLSPAPRSNGGIPQPQPPAALAGPPPPAAIPPPPRTAAPAPPEPSGLAANRRLALHLLRHMGSLPSVAPGELPGPEWTQSGLATAMGAGQSAISRILRRLVAAKVVESEPTHVAGGGRRVRVYRLTPRGVRLARALSGTDGPVPTNADLDGEFAP